MLSSAQHEWLARNNTDEGTARMHPMACPPTHWREWVEARIIQPVIFPNHDFIEYAVGDTLGLVATPAGIQRGQAGAAAIIAKRICGPATPKGLLKPKSTPAICWGQGAIDPLLRPRSSRVVFSVRV